jgi:hypothetical protein
VSISAFAVRSIASAMFALAGIQVICGDAEREPPAAQATRPTTLASSAMDTLAGPASSFDLDVMTFNLRYAGSTPPNSWAQRRPVMRDLLTTERPDLLGTQEGLPAQLADIRNDLGAGYEYIGTGRDGWDLGEHMAIFYDKARLLPLRSGNYWLSETPEVPGSRSWGRRTSAWSPG